MNSVLWGLSLINRISFSVHKQPDTTPTPRPTCSRWLWPACRTHAGSRRGNTRAALLGSGKTCVSLQHHHFTSPSPSKIHRQGDSPNTRSPQSAFNLFFFGQSPGLEASSCSGRLGSICIVRLSALLLLRVLTRDRRVCGPACPLWGVAPHIHTSRWPSGIQPTRCGWSHGHGTGQAAGRSGRYSRGFKAGLRAPAAALWGSGEGVVARSGGWTQQSCSNGATQGVVHSTKTAAPRAWAGRCLADDAAGWESTSTAAREVLYGCFQDGLLPSDIPAASRQPLASLATSTPEAVVFKIKAGLFNPVFSLLGFVGVSGAREEVLLYI